MKEQQWGRDEVKRGREIYRGITKALSLRKDSGSKVDGVYHELERSIGMPCESVSDLLLRAESYLESLEKSQ